MSAASHLATQGLSQRTRDRVLDPAQRLVVRLEAAGAKRDAQILRTLLMSHASQRNMLRRYYNQLQRTPSGNRCRAAK